MALHLQNQIRNNAEEVNGFFQDMVKWEKDIKAKDKKIIQKKLTKRNSFAPSTRQGAGTVAVCTTAPAADKNTSAANHTYDVGYQKWEKIKISESDDLVEEASNNQSSGLSGPTIPPASTSLTPASLVSLPTNTPSVSQQQVPKALGKASNVDIETYERERGNSEFKNGNFANAIKCYTKCLGLKPKNYIAFSNRAMAYLKLKEHHKAEVCFIKLCSTCLNCCHLSLILSLANVLLISLFSCFLPASQNFSPPDGLLLCTAHLP